MYSQGSGLNRVSIGHVTESLENQLVIFKINCFHANSYFGWKKKKPKTAQVYTCIYSLNTPLMHTDIVSDWQCGCSSYNVCSDWKKNRRSVTYIRDLSAMLYCNFSAKNRVSSLLCIEWFFSCCFTCAVWLITTVLAMKSTKREASYRSSRGSADGSEHSGHFIDTFWTFVHIWCTWARTVTF